MKVELVQSTASESAHAQQTAPQIRRTDFVLLGVLAALIVVSWLPRMHGPLDFRWDGGVYYVLGTALAEGKGYRLLNEPGEIEAVQYPPLLPAIVAVHQVVLGTSDPIIVGRWLRLSFFLISLLYISCSYFLLRIFLPQFYAFGAALMVLFNFFTNFLSDLCFAEIPFALTVTLFVLCNRRPGRLYAVVAALLAMAAYLLRTVGIAVLVAWICESFFKRQYRQAAMRAAVSFVPILAWNGYIYSVESSPSYQQPAYEYQRAEYLFYNVSYATNVSLRDPFTPELGKLTREDLAQRFVHNLAHMPTSLGEGLSAKIGYWRKYMVTMLELFQAIPGVWRIHNYAGDVILPVLGGLMCVGMVFLARQGEIFIPIYLLLVLVALCLTPWPEQWPRYWAPTVPFLALALFRCVWATHSDSRASSWPFKRVRLTGTILVGLVFTCQLFTLYTAYVNQTGQAAYRDRHGHVVSARLFFYKEEGYRELDVGVDWLIAHTNPTDVVAASMPHWVYLRTGLKSVMPPLERDTGRMQALLDSVPVTYVVVDASPVNFARNYILPLLRNDPHRWSLVHTVPTPKPDSGDTDGGALEIYQRIHR